MHTIENVLKPAAAGRRSRWPAKAALALLALGGFGLAHTAQAVHPLIMIEESYELLPADTRWPDMANGAVLLPGCARCKQERYVLGNSARFQVGREAASYRQFLAAVRSSRASAVFIFIDRSSGELVRATVMP